MDESVGSRLKHAWNVFRARDETDTYTYKDMYAYSSYNPTRSHISPGNERSIIAAIYTRIAMDVAAFDIQHVRTDDNNRFMETIDSGLNNCLTIEANKDQTGRAFIQDVVMSMFDEGCVAIVPVDTTISPKVTGSYEINTMRTGRIVEWYPNHVRVELYNDSTGNKERILLPKNIVGIVENPLYAVMNEPNSTLKRLIRKLNLLDAIDEQSGSGKLDLIIQLPYVIKSEARQRQAEERRKAIEQQLSGSKYGIAYTDGTEHITQLNRPAENNLMKQIEFLTNMLFGQLGITPEIMNNTADEKTMLNYITRTVEPMLDSVVEALKSSFLTQTALTQKQSIAYFRQPFKLVPIGDIAEIADKFTRNEILSSNEIRQLVGFKPAGDPKADQLINSNMPQPLEAEAGAVPEEVFDDLDSTLDQVFADLGVDEDAIE